MFLDMNKRIFQRELKHETRLISLLSKEGMTIEFADTRKVMSPAGDMIFPS